MMQGIVQFILVVAALTLLPPPTRAQPVLIPPGSASVAIRGAAPDGSAMTVWTYRPAELVATDRIVFVMHGVQRDASVYRDAWVTFAEHHRFLLVVPEMTQAQFPGDAGYNFGNMVDTQGNAKPPVAWAWTVLEKIFDAVKAGTGSKRETYALYGHSAGAQFVHRLVLFADNPRLDVAIAANAGWYTLPLFSEPFPYGLGSSPAVAARVTANFAKPLLVLLGSQDIDPNHRVLRRDAGSDRQGTNRFARGQFFQRTAEGEAARLGVPFNWRLEVVPGVGHDNPGMAAAAVHWLYPAKQ